MTTRAWLDDIVDLRTSLPVASGDTVPAGDELSLDVYAELDEAGIYSCIFKFDDVDGKHGKWNEHTPVRAVSALDAKFLEPQVLVGREFKYARVYQNAPHQPGSYVITVFLRKKLQLVGEAGSFTFVVAP